jgi:DNA-binding response OmpR family regulator
MRILVIEDEPQLARHISSALMRKGHTPLVQHDGAAGLQAGLTEKSDLIVLDLNLPALDGMSVLGQLRQAKCSARVIILTARGDVEQRIRGLNAGADDYLSKPFSMDELVARIEALGRRVLPGENSPLLSVGDLHLQILSRRVTRAGEVISLSPRELDVLQVLMQEPGRVFSRTELCERIWQREHEYDTRTVEIFITRLRKKIDEGYSEPLIHTIRTVGYTVRQGGDKAAQ